MPKTKQVVAVVDRDNHRTEYQLLTNILIDDKRILGDVIKVADADHDDVVKLKKALNDAIDDIHLLASKLKLILGLLKSVLTDADYEKMIELLNEEETE